MHTCDLCATARLHSPGCNKVLLLQSSAPKPQSSFRSGQATSGDKPPVESTQESTGSSQADTAQRDSEMLKVKKCDRKVRSTSDLRATRRTIAAIKGPVDKGAMGAPVPPQASSGAAAPATSSAPAQAPMASAAAAQPQTTSLQLQQQSMLPYNPQVRYLLTHTGLLLHSASPSSHALASSARAAYVPHGCLPHYHRCLGFAKQWRCTGCWTGHTAACAGYASAAAGMCVGPPYATTTRARLHASDDDATAATHDGAAAPDAHALGLAASAWWHDVWRPPDAPMRRSAPGSPG